MAWIEVNLRFSDTFALAGLWITFACRCCLTRHVEEYMPRDTGQPMATDPTG